MDLIGFQEGRTLKGAVPMMTNESEGSSSNNLSEEEVKERRRTAAENLQNISDEERTRRDQIGNIMAVVSVAYASWASLIADDGGVGGHFLRLALALPVFFALGFKKSAQAGL